MSQARTRSYLWHSRPSIEFLVIQKQVNQFLNDIFMSLYLILCKFYFIDYEEHPYNERVTLCE